MAKKYYWLKLQKDFFKRHDIRIIEDMPNGKDYILFYMKLLVESISHEGELRFNETIPYNEQMLSTITNTNIDIVRSAVKIFSQLHLMDYFDDGTFFMKETEKMLGIETEWAEKKRQYRKANKDKKRTLSDKSKILELEIDKEIDKDIEINTVPKKPTKHKHGEYKNVLLSDSQYSKLLEDWGQEKLDFMIQKLDEGIQLKAYKYKDHNLAIRKWEKETKFNKDEPKNNKWQQEANFEL